MSFFIKTKTSVYNDLVSRVSQFYSGNESDHLRQEDIWSMLPSLRKQPTFRQVATWTLSKRRLSNERRNSILMTRHYPDLGSASDYSDYS